MKQLSRLTWLGVLLVLGPVACNDADRDQARSEPDTKKPVAETPSSTVQDQDSAVSSPTTIPSDVTYTIINTDVIPGLKRSLDIRLNRKVSKDVLRLIAMNLKKDDPKRYKRTFIVYYLPDMEVGAGGWATTHFNPELEVKILGLTTKQEEALATKVEDAEREVVGSWFDQTPMVGGKISIYHKDGKVYMERTFNDGSSSKKEMVKKPSSNGKRFEEKSGSNFGEHYIIDQQDNLQIRDQEGLISTARKID